MTVKILKKHINHIYQGKRLRRAYLLDREAAYVSVKEMNSSGLSVPSNENLDEIISEAYPSKRF